MAKHAILMNDTGSPYAGECFVLMTKHAKSAAIAEPIWDSLGASMLEYTIDTDLLGTFTGEVEREGSPLECARRKCELGLAKLPKAEFAVASEGSFGPHPHMPLLPGGTEILCFVDRRRGIELHVSKLTEKTNYAQEVISDEGRLMAFAENALFPSHALIVRPNKHDDKAIVFKGLDTGEALVHAFRESCRLSEDGVAWVETDMRAHVNPTRMAVIGELASELAERLSSECPRCFAPGWGKDRIEQGLRCRDCGSETELAKAEIWACTSCDHEEVVKRNEMKLAADPEYCHRCNP